MKQPNPENPRPVSETRNDRQILQEQFTQQRLIIARKSQESKNPLAGFWEDQGQGTRGSEINTIERPTKTSRAQTKSNISQPLDKKPKIRQVQTDKGKVRETLSGKPKPRKVVPTRSKTNLPPPSETTPQHAFVPGFPASRKKTSVPKLSDIKLKAPKKTSIPQIRDTESKAPEKKSLRKSPDTKPQIRKATSVPKLADKKTKALRKTTAVEVEKRGKVRERARNESRQGDGKTLNTGGDEVDRVRSVDETPKAQTKALIKPYKKAQTVKATQDIQNRISPKKARTIPKQARTKIKSMTGTDTSKTVDGSKPDIVTGVVRRIDSKLSITKRPGIPLAPRVKVLVKRILSSIYTPPITKPRDDNVREMVSAPSQHQNKSQKLNTNHGRISARKTNLKPGKGRIETVKALGLEISGTSLE